MMKPGCQVAGRLVVPVFFGITNRIPVTLTIEPHSNFGSTGQPPCFRSGFCGELEARHESPAERRQGISPLGRCARGACGARARVDGEIFGG